MVAMASRMRLISLGLALASGWAFHLLPHPTPALRQYNPEQKKACLRPRHGLAWPKMMGQGGGDGEYIGQWEERWGEDPWEEGKDGDFYKESSSDPAHVPPEFLVLDQSTSMMSMMKSQSLGNIPSMGRGRPQIHWEHHFDDLVAEAAALGIPREACDKYKPGKLADGDATDEQWRNALAAVNNVIASRLSSNL